MNKLVIFLLSSFLFCTPSIFGQTNTISGKCYFEKSLEVVDSLRIELLDSLGNKIKTVFSNKKGNYQISGIEPGTYQILASSQISEPLMFDGILVGAMDLENVDLQLTKSCKEPVPNSVCPYCKKKKKVLKVYPGNIVSLNFGENVSRLKRYEKKIRRKGFETFINQKGEEIVISVFLENEKEKFFSFCYHWFCKRCKKVF